MKRHRAYRLKVASQRWRARAVQEAIAFLMERKTLERGRECVLVVVRRRSARMRCTIFANIKPGQTQILSGRRWVWGRSVYVSALRLDDGELLIIVSPDSSQTAISDYAKRWGIETLFGMFKTRGFCLESTHFTDSERLSKLLALMTRGLSNRQSCASATI